MYLLGKPDRVKIDGIYQKHLETGGTFNDEQLSLYFNNLMIQHNEAETAELRQQFKERLLVSYDLMSKNIKNQKIKEQLESMIETIKNENK
jgi:hypothetical protein